MLGKLYKHEFKSTAKQFVPIMIIVLIAALINRIQVSTFVLEMFQVLSIIVITAFVIITLVLLISRFKETMIGDQGYLSHTLPVNSWEHLLVKSTVSSFWLIISLKITIFSFLLSIPEKDLFSKVCTDIGRTFAELALDLQLPVGVVVLEVILYAIILPMVFFCMVYLAIALGQLWNGHTKLGTFLAVIGIYISTSFLSRIVFSAIKSVLHLNYYYGILPEEANALVLITLAYFVLLGLIAFFASSYLFKNKLNLQ